jgi:hypothetical protein
MTDTFPAMQQDCLDLGKKLNRPMLLSRQCRTACVMGDAETVRSTMASIPAEGARLGEFASAFDFAPLHDEG